MASAKIFGTVNQKSPASPCWYAKSVDTKTAGAHIHEAAILEPPKNQPTFLSPTRKFSTEVRFCHHAKRYVAASMNTPNAKSNRYVAPVDSVTRECTHGNLSSWLAQRKGDIHRARPRPPAVYNGPVHLARLRGRKIVDRVRRRGRKWRGKHMTIVHLYGGPPERESRKSYQLFAGTLVSSHLEKSAVKRNRMRRRCREALRIVLRATSDKRQANEQLLILPHSSSLTCAFTELTDDVTRFLLHLRNHVS